MNSYPTFNKDWGEENPDPNVFVQRCTILYARNTLWSVRTRSELSPKFRESSVEFVPQAPELVPVRDGRVRDNGGVHGVPELHVVEHLPNSITASFFVF